MNQRSEHNSFTVTADGGNVHQPLRILIEAAESVAKIKITGNISEWSDASAMSVGYQIEELVKKGVKDGEVYINSKGGDTIEASEIVNTLRKLPGKITAIGGAVVASAASYIAVKLDGFYPAKNTQFMYHKPRMLTSGTLEEIKARLKFLENTESDYAQAYASKTGKTEAQIRANWEKGDVWLMGDEIVKQGFADGLKEEIPITAEDVLALTASGAPVIPQVNQISNQNNKISAMEKVKLIASLGLPADATDEQIQAAVTANKQAADKISQIEADRKREQETAQANTINTMVEAAVTDKRITADQKEYYLKLAKADFESCKALLESIKPVEKPNPIGGSNPSASTEDRSNWTYADYREKDQEAFFELMKTDPAKAEALADAFYKN